MNTYFQESKGYLKVFQSSYVANKTVQKMYQKKGGFGGGCIHKYLGYNDLKQLGNLSGAWPYYGMHITCKGFDSSCRLTRYLSDRRLKSQKGHVVVYYKPRMRRALKTYVDFCDNNYIYIYF